MVRLTWNERNYETGLDQGVFFPANGSAQAWDGLVSVDVAPVDIRERVRYRDGQKVVNQRAEDSFAASIACISCPEAIFSNSRTPFGMSYRVKTNKGYKIHLVYNALARLTSRSYVQNDTTPIAFDITTRPMDIPQATPSAHLIVDSSVAYPQALADFEDILYGSEYGTARLPLPDELFGIFDVHTLYKVIDNGDGTFTLDAPSTAFNWLSDTEVEIDWPRSPIFVDEYTYRITSW